MKYDLSCEHYKPLSKNGQTSKCFCKFLTRNRIRDLKINNMHMANYEKMRLEAALKKK